MAMNRKSERLAVTISTKNLVNDCITEFLNKNPNFNRVKITQDFIIERIALYYLERL